MNWWHSLSCQICFRLKFKYVDSGSFGKGVQPAECGGDLMQAGGEAHEEVHRGASQHWSSAPFQVRFLYSKGPVGNTMQEGRLEEPGDVVMVFFILRSSSFG